MIIFQKTSVQRDIGFEVDENVPTNRTAGIPYDKDVNFTAIIDGFIVSDNINVVAKKGNDLQFKYSDHNPQQQ